MIDETISRIEARLRQTDAVDTQARAELLGLLGQLRGEIAGLARTHTEEAQRIAGLTQASAQEATAEPRNPEGLRETLDELAASVEGFESSHPQLVQVVNRIATTLSNIGI